MNGALESLTARNRAFVTNLFRKGPFTRHGFNCGISRFNVDWSKGDYTTGGADLDAWTAQFAQQYEQECRDLEIIGDDRVPAARMWTGSQIYAEAFGCGVNLYPQDPPASRHLVETPGEADKIELPDMWSSPNIMRIFEMGRKLLARLGPDTPLSPPDMQSGFDIACQIWNKEQLFYALVEDKDAVHRLADKCRIFYKQVQSELRREFPTMHPNHCPMNWTPPEMGVWVSNDECGIMSNKMFREFMLPELIDISQTYGGIGMHCCAGAEHQFPLFKEIPGWYAFNRVPAQKGIEPILEHFSGPDSPVHCLAWINDEKTDWLIQNAAPGTRFIFSFFGSTEEQKRWFDHKMEKYGG